MEIHPAPVAVLPRGCWCSPQANRSRRTTQRPVFYRTGVARQDRHRSFCRISFSLWVSKSRVPVIPLFFLFAFLRHLCGDAGPGVSRCFFAFFSEKSRCCAANTTHHPHNTNWPTKPTGALGWGHVPWVALRTTPHPAYVCQFIIFLRFCQAEVLIGNRHGFFFLRFPSWAASFVEERVVKHMGAGRPLGGSLLYFPLSCGVSRQVWQPAVLSRHWAFAEYSDTTLTQVAVSCVRISLKTSLK